jgi:hypothetical protein
MIKNVEHLHWKLIYEGVNDLGGGGECDVTERKQK